jgi:hypothetical protein
MMNFAKAPAINPMMRVHRYDMLPPVFGLQMDSFGQIAFANRPPGGSLNKKSRTVCVQHCGRHQMIRPAPVIDPRSGSHPILPARWNFARGTVACQFTIAQLSVH